MQLEFSKRRKWKIIVHQNYNQQGLNEFDYEIIDYKMKQYKKIAQSIYLFCWKKLKVGFRFCRDETTLAYGFSFLLDCESEILSSEIITLDSWVELVPLDTWTWCGADTCSL